MRQNDTPSPRRTYDILAAMLTLAEREILETLGEIIALDLLRQQHEGGTALNPFETDFVNPAGRLTC